ncbi:WXG100 family type VII secretion target [Streptomyces sp. NPDC060198]|uniref:WXG100 family type VII secretion target n=1 Tax=Streptomyces sp. NPDC060198 TaxID=3347070 RepID=UPI0036686E24
MATQDYAVTLQMVTDAASSCRGTAEEVSQQLDSLKTYIVNLESSWQGIAHETFTTYMAQYDVYARMLHQALTDIADGLTNTHINYHDAEAAALQSFQQMESELPPARLG